MNLILLLSYSSYIAAAVYFLYFGLKNYRIGYRRAALSAAFLCLLFLTPIVFLRNWFLFHLASVCVISLFLLALLIPIHKLKKRIHIGDKRFDERDIPFARFLLKPGTENYESYYQRNPHNEDIDRRTRALPGLLAEKSKFYHHFNSAAADSSFFLLEQLKNAVDGVTAEEKHRSPEEITDFIRSLSKHYEASCFGTTRLNPLHYYSNVGRGDGKYGSDIPVVHKNALVFGSEMEPRLTGSAPYSPEVVEVGRRYVDCAVWAIETAAFIRSMGYSAKAHIDGNYKVVVPLVARDAQLGGFGWSGLLLSKKYGPRVRYSVVTTEMSVPAESGKRPDFLSFCNLCRKCAINCPSRSIDPRSLRKPSADKCFMYWNAIGTDCGRCIAVCPFGHPWGLLKDIALHSIVAAWFLKNLDDLCYGRKPSSLLIPRWMDTTE